MGEKAEVSMCENEVQTFIHGNSRINNRNDNRTSNHNKHDRYASQRQFMMMHIYVTSVIHVMKFVGETGKRKGSFFQKQKMYYLCRYQ